MASLSRSHQVIEWSNSCPSSAKPPSTTGMQLGFCNRSSMRYSDVATRVAFCTMLQLTGRACTLTFCKGRVVTAPCTSSLHNIFRFHVKEHGTSLQDRSHIFGSAPTCSHHTPPALQGGSGHCQASWSIRYFPVFLQSWEGTPLRTSPLFDFKIILLQGFTVLNSTALLSLSSYPEDRAVHAWRGRRLRAEQREVNACSGSSLLST